MCFDRLEHLREIGALLGNRYESSSGRFVDFENVVGVAEESVSFELLIESDFVGVC